MGDKGYQLTSDAPKKHEKGGRLPNQETDARRFVAFLGRGLESPARMNYIMPVNFYAQK